MGFITFDGNNTMLQGLVDSGPFTLALLTSVTDRNVAAADLDEPDGSVTYTTNITYAVDHWAAWASGNSYGVGSIIYYTTNSTFYSCILANTSSGSILPTNATYWTATTVSNTYMTYYLPTASTDSLISGQNITVSSVATNFNGTFTIQDNIANAFSIWNAATTYKLNDIVVVTEGLVSFYYKRLIPGQTNYSPRWDVLNWEFYPVTDYTQFVVSSNTAFHSSWTGTGGAALASTNYSRQTYSGTWTVANSSAFNDAAITWPAANLDWGRIVGWALIDSFGKVAAIGEMQNYYIVNQNGIVNIPDGSLRLYVN